MNIVLYKTKFRRLIYDCRNDNSFCLQCVMTRTNLKLDHYLRRHRLRSAALNTIHSRMKKGCTMSAKTHQIIWSHATEIIFEYRSTFHHYIFSVSFVIQAAVAANSTASNRNPGVKTSEAKNKRQVDEYLRTPGSSAATAIGSESGPQLFPVQFSHGIYNQHSLYKRRPSSIHTPLTTEADEEHESQQQQQQQVRYLFTRTNYLCTAHFNNWYFE